MNRNVLFAAVIIAVLASSAAYTSPMAEASNIESHSTPQRSMAPPAPDLTIAPSLRYEINGTLYAWINVTGSLTADSNLPFMKHFNVTINQIYVGIHVAVWCTNITIDTNTGQGTADLNMTARIVGKVDIDVNGTIQIKDNFEYTHSLKWQARLLVPWGDTKNFTAPIPVLGSEQTSNTTASPDPVQVVLTHDNITDDGILRYGTIKHTSWDFGNWMKQKVQQGLNGIWDQFNSMLPSELQGKVSFNFQVVRSEGRVDLWKADVPKLGGGTVYNVLLMASVMVNLLIKFDLTTGFQIDVSYGGQHYTVNVTADFHARLGVFFVLEVTSSVFRDTLVHGTGGFSGYLYELTVQVPENATLTWRKIGVIVYYGSPVHDMDFVGGKARGNATYGGQPLFFVDYGWDGTPDFGTNGTVVTSVIRWPNFGAGNITGSGLQRTVHLSKASGWNYFDLNVPPGYSVKSISRNGTTLNGTQWWVVNGVLYVCDDPTSSYVIDFVSGAPGGAELTLFIYVGIAAVALIAVAAFVFMRRRSVSSTVTVK